MYIIGIAQVYQYNPSRGGKDDTSGTRGAVADVPPVPVLIRAAMALNYVPVTPDRPLVGNWAQTELLSKVYVCFYSRAFVEYDWRRRGSHGTEEALGD